MDRNMKKILRMAALAALTLSVLVSAASCGKSKKTEKYDEGKTVMYCDEGFASFMEEEIDVFEYQYPKAFVLSRYMSETEAINGMMQDSCQIIVTSKPLTAGQIEYLKNHYKRVARSLPIAVDAVALIVNKKNSLERLNLYDIKDMLTGKVTTWDQMQRVTEGKLDTTKIKIVFDREGSATVNYMQDKFLNGGDFPSNAYAQASSIEVFKAVENDPSAIGIISVGWLGENLEKRSAEANKVDDNKVKGLQDEQEQVEVQFTDKIKVLAVGDDNAAYAEDYYLPYQAYIFEKDKYPLVRTIYMTSAAPQKSVGQSFYSFVTGYIGQKILARTGILPYNMPMRVVDLGE